MTEQPRRYDVTITIDRDVGTFPTPPTSPSLLDRQRQPERPAL